MARPPRLGRSETASLPSPSAPIAEGGARCSAQACPECANFTLVRNGTCLKCDTCGSTTGCS
ncbi:hypothetical protein CTI14_56460 [Methylobacterium radiotolerans]|nr:hypothetical protein CTI14_56460 [Methylobacterium radiotolerans]